MHLVCVSASNIRHARNCSTSLKICHLIQQIATEKRKSSPTVDIIALVDYELKPCIGCGVCLKHGACTADPVFNKLYARLTRADGVFVVSAHYAPIPAKLCMLLEKIEQLAFLPRFHDETHRSPLHKRPIGIIFGLITARPHVYEASGLGAAIDAAVGLGLHPGFETAVREMTHTGDVFEPNPQTREIYERLYQRVYKRMYERLKPLYEEIRHITGYPSQPGK